MNIISRINRKESNEKTDELRPILYTKILAILSEGEKLTANEIAKKINKKWNRQNTQPRLTELVEKGLVEVSDKKYDKETDRNVSTYKLIEENENHIPRID